MKKLKEGLHLEQSASWPLGGVLEYLHIGTMKCGESSVRELKMQRGQKKKPDDRVECCQKP